MNSKRGWRSDYYLYSSVLGAKVVELDGNAQKTKGYVYANGQRLAKQVFWPGVSYVNWHHPNAGNNSWVESDTQRGEQRQEMDPMGAEVGTTDPWLYYSEPSYSDVHLSDPLYLEGGDPFDYSGGCTSFGMPISCTDAAGYVRRGLGNINGIGSTGANSRGQPPGGGSSVWVDEVLIQLAYVNNFIDGETSEGEWTLYRDTRSGFANVPFARAQGQPQDPRPRKTPIPPPPAPPLGLTPCVKSRLAPYFPGVKLDAIRIHFGFPRAARLAGGLGDLIGIQTLGGAQAITIGNDIYFRSQQLYNPDSIRGIGLIGHEVRHVAQYQSGNFSSLQYVREYYELRRAGLSDRAAYENINFEREASRTQDLIETDLQNLRKQLGENLFWSPCPPFRR